jgi:2-iminobutanoate/2-iminopropanoate deaminase
MVARSHGSTEIVAGGPGAEVKQILLTLTSGLADFGLTLDDMIKCTIFTTDLDRMEDISASWNAVFTEDVRPPARTTVGVAKLPLRATVEMEFQFYKE